MSVDTTACLTTARLAAEALDASAAFVVLEASYQPLRVHYGLSNEQQSRFQAVFASVRPSGEPLVIEDTEEEDTRREYPWLDGLPAVRFLAGVPVETSEGSSAGMLYVVDSVPHQMRAEEVDLLRQVARLAAADLLTEQEDILSSDGSQLCREQNFSKGTLDALSDVFFVFTPDGEFLRWNRQAKAVTGYTDEEIASMHPVDFFRGKDAPHIREAIECALEGGKHTVEAELITKEGTRIPYEFTGSILRDETGAMLGVCGIGRDITERKKSEQALRESEDRWRALVESHPDPVVVSQGGQILYANPAAARFFEVPSPETALGRSIDEFVPKSSHDTLYERLNAIEEGKSVEPLEYRVQTEEGEERIVEARGAPVRFNGKMAAQTVVRDVTERKRAERALQQSQERLELAVSGASLGLWDWNVETGEVAFNEQWAEMLGYSLDEIEPRIESWINRVHPKDFPRVRETLRDHLEGETPYYETTYRMQAKDGSWQWKLDRGKVVERADDGTPRRVTGLHHDITDRKRAENELRSTKQLLEKTLESLNEAVIVVDPAKRKIVACNAAVEQIFGYEKEELIGDSTEVLHVDREAYERFGAISEAALEEDGRFTGEYKMRHKEGHDIITEHLVAPLENEDWSRSVVSVVRDVTERKEAELELRESEARNRAMLQAIPDLIFRFSEEGVYLEVQAEEEGQLAKPPEELVGKSLREVLPPDLAEKWTRMIRGAIETRDVQQGEYTLTTQSGEERIFEARVAPLGECEAEAIVRDITDRRKAENELRSTKQLLEKTLESLNEAVIVVDPAKRKIVACNAAVEQIFGYEKEELIGDSTEVLHVDREAYERFASVGEPTLEEKGYFTCEYKMRHKEGHIITTEHVVTPLQGEEWSQGVVSVIRDVTERKQQQQRLIEAKEHAEEMNRLKSAFLANMSHELRTPLTSILGFAEILSEEVEGSNREFAHLIAQSGRRLMETLNSVLNLAQLESKTMALEMECVDLAKRAREAISMFDMQAREQGVELRSDIPSGPTEAMADQNAVDRILNNLISNALKFTPDGQVTVRVNEREEQVELQVEDTGVGIDAEFLPYVFEEFRQESTGTSREFEGVGLGLTITRRLVDHMDGTIDVESTKGEGTTFRVCLPNTNGDRGPS